MPIDLTYLDTIILNFDGTLIRNSELTSVGVILQDAQYVVLLASSMKEHGVFDVDNIEALVALWGYNSFCI